MQLKKLSVLRNFSEYPKLRYCNLSASSAEKFYHEQLNPCFASAFEERMKLEVDISNTAGYTSSFLDEAFGNLVYDFTLTVVKEWLTIVSIDEPYWIEMIETQTFPQWEERRTTNLPPTKTFNHPPWFRLINGKLEKKIWVNV